MKSLKQIDKMLEGYLVGRPVSRSRKYRGYEIILRSEYSAMTVYTYNGKTVKFKQVFYSSWKDAFVYYYNTIILLMG